MANQMMTTNNNRRGLSARRDQGNDYRGLISQFLNFLDFPNTQERYAAQNRTQ